MGRPRIDPLVRFNRNWIEDPETGCWNWKLRLCSKGYGRFGVDGVTYRAHRWIYLQERGVIVNGTIDHLCRNRACVNPDHLEDVTARENVLRGEGLAAENSAKSSCPSGHEYDYLSPEGGRSCSRCRAEAGRRFQSDRLRANEYKRAWRQRRRDQGLSPS